MEYLESVAVIVAPHISEPLVGDALMVAVAPEGDKPGIGEVETHVVRFRATAGTPGGPQEALQKAGSAGGWRNRQQHACGRGEVHGCQRGTLFSISSGVLL